MVATRVVLMGVCGCGKTTVGRVLAARLGLPFIEGDELHPPANVARMAAGVPLTDADREGWLQAVGAALAAAPQGAVASCSALKRRYREQLRAQVGGLRFVHLHGEPALLAERLATRQGHYMPAALLPSQLQILEPPAADEAALTLPITATADALAEQARAWLETTA
jgi:carbohydrate kinase (thermoresistant glucokinase family)